MASVIKPGIKRKKPPIGVNNVFKTLSALGSITVLLSLMFNSVLKPWFRSR